MLNDFISFVHPASASQTVLRVNFSARSLMRFMLWRQVTLFAMLTTDGGAFDSGHVVWK